MKSKTQILILFFILLAVPTSTVLACGNLSEKQKTDKTSCYNEDNLFEKKLCCDNDEKDDDACSGECDNTSCHCPSTINIPVSFNDFEFSDSNNFKLLINDCAYLQHLPKAVYLSIWQPPKIS